MTAVIAGFKSGEDGGTVVCLAVVVGCYRTGFRAWRGVWKWVEWLIWCIVEVWTWRANGSVVGPWCVEE